MISNFNNDYNTSSVSSSISFLDLNQQTLLESNKDIAILIRFLKQMRLPQMFSNLTDQRDDSKTTYTNTSSAMGFLCLFFSSRI